MASATNSPATAANDSSIGTVSWSNPTNVVSSNNTRALAALNGTTSYYLVAKSFGFALPNSTINGIEVSVERRDLFGVVTDNAVQLFKSGVAAGENVAAGGAWPTSDTVATYGGASDLFGTTWTYVEINSNLEVGMSATAAGEGNAEIDHISVTVYYTEITPVGPAQRRSMSRRVSNLRRM